VNQQRPYRGGLAKQTTIKGGGISSLHSLYFSWCPACQKLGVRPIQGGCGVRAHQCTHCYHITIEAPRVLVWDGKRNLHRVIYAVDNAYGLIRHRGRLLKVRRGPDGAWFIVGTH